jgi:cell wall-associated NlpC family hydrolase
MDPRDLLAAMQRGKLLAYYHSHPNGVAIPSMADKSACEALGLPWHIVSWPRKEHEIYSPCGYQAPYLARPFVHGVHDCYSLVRDWYNREWDLGLPDIPRDERWWAKGQNLYIDNFEKQGFVRLPEGAEMQVGDGFLMQLGSDVSNHAAVFLGNTRIMHHPQSQLSSITIYGGFWQKVTTHHLRHKSKC